MSGPGLVGSTGVKLGDAGNIGSKARQLRNLWAIDCSARLIARVQTPVGKLMLTAIFIVLAKLSGVFLLSVLFAVAYAYLPAQRRWIALAGAAAMLVRHAPVELAGIQAILLEEGRQASLAALLNGAAIVLYFLLAWITLLLVRRDKTLFVARRPVVSLLGLAALLCAACFLPFVQGLPRAALWAFLTVFVSFIWFFAYALVDQRSRDPSALPFQIGILHPFWGSSSTPFGKGGAFLRKHQAKTAEELAVTQLKACKLLVWAGLLELLRRLLIELFEIRIGIPRPAAVYTAFVQGTPYSVATNWASLTWATLAGTLSLAVWGHKIIAVARLAGFRLPRNTWRPLEARTLAEFWNRYYYYFKELLVEFFFFPTFLKVFRKHPRLRVFIATFMAAGVGNLLYHFIRDIRYVAILGPRQAAASYAGYVVYCTALAVGIGISQARMTAGRKLPTTWIGSLWSILCVWSFFIGLQVFSDETRVLSFQDRIFFFAGLFGLE